MNINEITEKYIREGMELHGKVDSATKELTKSKISIKISEGGTPKDRWVIVDAFLKNINIGSIRTRENPNAKNGIEFKDTSGIFENSHVVDALRNLITK